MKSRANWLSLLFQKKMLLILALGFASGLPLGLSGSTLQAWYAVSGVDILTIGFLALVGYPYTCKFLWAPLMDKWQPPFLGLRRGWMVVTQVGLIITLILMAFLDPKVTPYHLAFLALCLAFLSASQDIVYDAYRTELLAVEERGLGTSMTTVGYRMAMLVSTSLTLILAHYAGFKVTYLFMAVLMGIGIIATLWSKEPIYHQAVKPSFLATFVEPFKEFFSRKQAWLLLGFIIFYKLGDAYAGSLTTTFLLKGVGFSLKEIGIINKTGGLISSLLGIFVGGILMVKLGLFRALWIFGVIQGLTNLLYWVLSYTGPNYMMLLLAVGGENFGGGLGTAAFVALVMSLCNPRFTATQFALLSALAAVGRVFVGPSAAYLVNELGWSDFFLLTIVFALPGLILLGKLKATIEDYQNLPKKEVSSEPEESVA